MSIKKGVSFILIVVLVDKNGAPVTGGTTTCIIIKDGGSPSASTNSPSAITGSNGEYQLLLTATEMDADVVHVTFVSDVDDVAPVGFNLITTTKTNQELSDELSTLRGTDSDTLETLSDQLDVVIGGPLSVEVEYTVNNTSTGMPIEGALVEVFTDVTMLNYVTKGYTDAVGKATFYLNPGTYYLRSTKSGFNFSNPDTEVVTS